jgi:hypothetical protein
MVTFCPLVSADAIVKATVTDFEKPGTLSAAAMVLETSLTDPTGSQVGVVPIEGNACAARVSIVLTPKRVLITTSDVAA